MLFIMMIPIFADMRSFIKRHRGSGIALAVLFVMQMVATTFCGTENAHAATTVSLSHDTMPMHCPMMDMHSPAQHGTTHCEHCHPPTFNQVADYVDHLSTTWASIVPLIHMTILENAGTRENPSAFLFSHIHGPPRSSTLIYNITQRIRV